MREEDEDTKEHKDNLISALRPRDNQAQGKYTKTNTNISKDYVIQLQREEACKLPKSNNREIISLAQRRAKGIRVTS